MNRRLFLERVIKIRPYNPLRFDFSLKRRLSVAGLRFSNSIFMTLFMALFVTPGFFH